MNEAIFLKTFLSKLQDQKLHRTLKGVSGAQGAHIVFEGRKVVNFCSNNYLGLANDVRLVKVAKKSLKGEGLGSGAARLICGNMNSHVQLEKKIATFKNVESCLVFSTGYMANVGILSALCDREDIIFSDKLNHASIIDGILLSRAKFKRYPHKDMNALEEMLKESLGYRKRLIVTDSVFSMDGDIAPLKEIVNLAKKYEAMVMIDEAHSFGVLGSQGRGLAEELGVEEDIDIHMGTLSKAVGSFGAYCCGSKALIDFLINKARSFIYTTAMPPSIAAASIQAIEMIKREPKRREKLLENATRMRDGLQAAGFDTLNSVTPIIPVLLKEASTAVAFSQKLFERGILVQAIRPPTVPENTARLRVTVMATHSKQDIEKALQLFSEVKEELCLT
ncbi:MAG: 8-amino-7-oxononanoate synthase [Candidatus Omnitrophota bacterium]